MPKSDNLRVINSRTNGRMHASTGGAIYSGDGMADTLDGYDASKQPGANLIPVSLADGKLDPGWLPEQSSSGAGASATGGQVYVAPWVRLAKAISETDTTIYLNGAIHAVGDRAVLGHYQYGNENIAITGGPTQQGTIYEYTITRSATPRAYPAGSTVVFNLGGETDGGYVTIVSGDQQQSLTAPHINLFAYEDGTAVRKVRIGRLQGLSTDEKAQFPKVDDWNVYGLYADAAYLRGQIVADSGDIAGDLDVGGTLGVWSGLGRAGVVLGNSEGGHGITLQNREGRPVFGAVSPYEDEGGVLSDVAVWIDNKGEKGLYYHLDPATNEYRLEIGVETLIDGQLTATNILAGTGTHPGAFTGMRFGAEGLQTYGTDYLEQVSIDVQDGRLYFGKREGWLSENGMTIDARLYPADIDDMEHTITWLHNSAYAPSYIGAAIGSQATGEVFMSTRRLMLDGGTPGSWTTNDYSEARLTLRAFDVSSLAGETVELYGRRGAQLRAGDYDYATLAPGGRFSVAFLTAGGTLLHTSDNGQTVSVGTNSATGARLITQADGMPAFRATRSGGQTFDITMEATRTLIGASNTIQIYTGAVDTTGQGQIIPAGYMRLGSQASPWQDVYGIRGHFGSLGSQTALAGQFYLTGKQATLMVGLEAENVIAYVRESDLAVGEFYRFEAVDGNHETIRINTVGVLTGDGWYEHEIERAQGADLDNETGLAAQWYEGQVGVSLGGNATDGYIRLWGADDQNPDTGPAIVVYQRDNDDLPGSVSERAVFGNLNGFYGYEQNSYGVAFGRLASQWVSLDEANGLRIMDATTQRAVYREYAQIGNPDANNVLITDSTLQLGVGDAYTISMDGSGDMSLTGTLAVATGGAITWAGGYGNLNEYGLAYFDLDNNLFEVESSGTTLVEIRSTTTTNALTVANTSTGATGLYVAAGNTNSIGLEAEGNIISIYGLNRVAGGVAIKAEAVSPSTTALAIVGGIVDGGSQRYTALADATAATDGLNRQTGDGRYLLQTGTAAGATSQAQTFNYGIVVNETSNDSDSRFEGNTDANLLFIDAGADRVGIGNAAPANKLHVTGDAYITTNAGIGAVPTTSAALQLQKTGDASAAASFGIDATGITYTAGANPVYGMRISGYSQTTSAQTGSVYGVSTLAANLSSGTVSALIANASGVGAYSTGNVTNAYAFQIGQPTIASSGVIGTSYGIYIAAQKVTGVTTGVSFWQQGASDLNYWAGEVGFNSGNWTLAQVHIVPSASSRTGLVVRGAASQSASLQEWQSNAPATLASISAAGLLTATGVNVPTGSVYKVNSVQVVGAQGSAVADATDAATAITQLNTLLARLRTHGLIAT